MDFHERGKDKGGFVGQEEPATERKIILTLYATPILVIWYDTFSS